MGCLNCTSIFATVSRHFEGERFLKSEEREWMKNESLEKKQCEMREMNEWIKSFRGIYKNILDFGNISWGGSHMEETCLFFFSH